MEKGINYPTISQHLGKKFVRIDQAMPCYLKIENGYRSAKKFQPIPGKSNKIWEKSTEKVNKSWSKSEHNQSVSAGIHKFLNLKKSSKNAEFKNLQWE